MARDAVAAMENSHEQVQTSVNSTQTIGVELQDFSIK